MSSRTKPTRFRLNNATSSSGKVAMTDREFSLWVGELSPDVDDYQLYKTFASRYESIRTAKVVLDSTGQSRGFGFIRFANEEEQKHCLANMNNFKVGTKPIKISTTGPKSYRQTSGSYGMSGGYSSSQNYSNYYDPDNYWQSYSSWHSYYNNPSSANSYNNYNFNNYSCTVQQTPTESQATDDLELIDHNTAPDIEGWNRELMERDYSMWDALESSKWLPLETYG